MANPADHESPLVVAAGAGNLPCVTELLHREEQATVKAPPTPAILGYALLAAVKNGHVAVAELLLDHGAKSTANCLVRAVQYEASDAMLQTLIGHGADVDGTTSAGLPILNTALGHELQLRFLLKHGADPNQMYTRWCQRPLDYAASFHSPQDIQILLQYGARLDQAFPLHSAAVAFTEKDRVPVMEYLIDECKIDVNSISRFGHRMSKRRGDEDGTPLHAAVRGGYKDRIAFLLRRGADPQVPSVRGHDVFDFCTANGLDNRLQLLNQVLAAHQQPTSTD